MNLEKFFYYGSILITIILSAVVIWRALRYTHYHPCGIKKVGAWLAVFACLGYDLNSARFLFSQEVVYAAGGIDMLSIVVNQGVLFIAAILLMWKSPMAVIDEEDAIIILNKFESASQAFIAMYERVKDKVE